MDNYLKHLFTVLPGDSLHKIVGDDNIITLKFEEVANESKKMKSLITYYKTVSEIFEYIKEKYTSTKMDVSGHDIAIIYS